MARKEKGSGNGSAKGNSLTLKKGDWIVHITHGIGEIIRVEKKLIGGKKTSCYRVQTDDSVYWIPVEAEIKDRVRTIASPQKFKRTVRLLSEPGKKMAKMHKVRRKRIHDHSLDGDLKTTALLIRDLWARKLEKSLNDTEMRALSKLTDRFVKEWSLAMEIPEEEAMKRLNELVMMASVEVEQE
jgi:RNA polymerase-interacting CarD/CdnL/TRCF family regulator